MDTNERLVLQYAKKIYGFAYSKTKNSYDAEDLSQEILVQLLDKRIDFDKIRNKDAYIYRICCYTWSNYLRKNKGAWNMLGGDMLESVRSAEDIEHEYIRHELYEELRREIMYLSKTRRDITIMYYYENKRSDEISKILGVSASTIRWHMKETKEILKERMDMREQNEIYTPVKLVVGHNGWVQDYNMHGLVTDVIMQNICMICREKPLTIEEMARTLGIAAIYLEDKIETLVYMDYLCTVGKNKYQTTFFIRDHEFYIAASCFGYEHAEKLALPIYELIKLILPAVRAGGYVDGVFSDDFLMYALAMLVIERVLGKLCWLTDKKLNLSYVCPKRKDGSEHFVSASFPIPQNPSALIQDQNFLDYLMDGGGSGVKTSDIDTASSLQVDQNEFGGWRDFECDDLMKLVRVHVITTTGEEPNDYDKDAIAILCKKGYVRVENEKPVLLVPILKPEYNLDKMLSDVGLSEEILNEKVPFDELSDLWVAHRKELDKKLPKYLDQNEHDYTLANAGSMDWHNIIYTMHKNGYLYTPSAEEQKRICTMIFLK